MDTRINNNHNHSRPTISIKCLQINCRRAYAPFKETMNYILQNNMDIAFVSEPYLINDHRPATINPITCFHHHTSNNRILATIYINNNTINPILIQQHSDSNFCVIDILLNDRKLRLISVYRPPNDVNSTEELIDKIEQALPTSTNHKIIIAGDFNAHHNAWGCPNNDDNGVLLYDLFMTNDLNLHNIGSTPTFIHSSNNASSIIDLTLASPQAIIEQWKVNPDAIITSDHQAIEFNILETCEQPTNRNIRQSTYRYRTDQANWDSISHQFKTEMESNNINEQTINKIHKPKEIDELIHQITRIIISVCDNNLKKRGLISSKKCPWWDNELVQLKRATTKAKHAFQNAKKNNDGWTAQQKLQILIDTKRKYTKKIRQKSNESFTKYLKSLEGMSDIKKVNKLLADTTRKIPSTLIVNGTSTVDHKSNTIALLDRFFPIHPEPDLQQPNYISIFGNDEIPITNHEILMATKCMNPNKAPGADGLTADIIHQFILANTSTIRTLLNKCLSLGHFPSPWKDATIRFLPKPGKSDYKSIDNYRPIGLLPVFGKVFEKIIIDRITYDLRQRGQLSPKQYGFTPQKSTINAVSDAVDWIKSKKKKKEHTVAVFMDIKNAFPSANHNILSQTLMSKQIRTNLYSIITNFLTGRNVKIDNYTRSNNIGCIQGSISGPTLWNILMDSIFEIDLPQGCQIIAFADDLLLLAHDKEPSNLASRTQQAIDSIIEWGNEKQLTFSATKTYIMGFSELARTINVKINNQPLAMKNQVKYLGIVLDQQLNFKSHAEYVIKKLTNLYNMLSRLVRPNWGLNPDISRLIYRMIAEPIALYGASIWHKAFETKKMAKRILSIQRRILVKACRGNNTMSYTSTFLISNIAPIDIKIKERAAMESTKILGRRPENIDRTIELESPVAVTNLPHPGKRIITNYLMITDHNDADRRITNNKISIFTDGSKMDGQTGAAYIITKNQQPIDQRKWRLADHCSVFQAELFAIKMALLHQPETTSEIQIFSDSKSSLDAIKDRTNCHPLVVDINNRIDELRETGTHVQLFWIKAHTDYIWNETADRLAKEATLEAITPESYNKMPMVSYKLKCRNQTNSEWTDRTTEASTGRWTTRLIPDLTTAAKWQSRVGIDRYLTQVLSNHGATRHYLWRFKSRVDNACPCNDQQPQTMEHLMLDCPIWADLRHRITTKHNIQTDDLANLETVLRNKDLVEDWTSYVRLIMDGLAHINREP